VTGREFQIRKVDSIEAILALESVWRELESPINASNLGVSFQVTMDAWRCLGSNQDSIFGYDRQLLVLEVSENGRTIAIAPFAKTLRDRNFGPFRKTVTCIEFLGHSLMARHFRLFYDIVTKEPSEDLTHAILDWLYENEQFDVIHFAYISEASASFSFVKHRLLDALLVSIVDVHQCGKFEDYRRAVYSVSLRQNLRTAINRAKGMGLQLEVDVREADRRSFADVAELASTKLDMPQFLECGYQAFLERLCTTGATDIALVYGNGKPLGYRVYLKVPSGRFELDTHRDWDFRRLELGSLLMDRAIKDSFENNVKVHYEGLFGGIHSERFATRLLRAYKFLSPGNTKWGKPTFAAIKLFHQSEERQTNQPKSGTIFQK
jgi:hypothetical protein